MCVSLLMINYWETFQGATVVRIAPNLQLDYPIHLADCLEIAQQLLSHFLLIRMKVMQSKFTPGDPNTCPAISSKIQAV